MERGSFKSRIGFLLVSAGCAIGIGNVWKFPYITGQYGGGVFVLFYLLFLIIMGAPVLTMELAVGRASRKSAEQDIGRWSRRAPTGSLVFLLFCVTRWGWGFDAYRKEANTGKGIRIAEGLKTYLRWVLPLLILVILIRGLLP